ncbi:toprim domain-containing protein [bacterium]|nr:toprim domain-containing protein [bacterium]
MIKTRTYSTLKSYLQMNLRDDIESFLEEYHLDIHSSSGSEYIIFCPFHKNVNTPSFYINSVTGLWQCFNPSCGKKGNFRQLYRHVTGRSFESKIKLDPVELQSVIDAGFIVQQEKDIDISTIGIDYNNIDEIKKVQQFIDRGLSFKTLQYFEIGFSEIKNRIVIPVRNHQYKIVGLIGRAISKEQEPRYLYNKGFKRADVLFNIQNAKHYTDVIVVEGSVDAMKVYEAGFPNVVATLGAQVSNYQASLLRKYFDSITIFSDADEAGNAMRDAIIDLCRGKKIYSAQISSGCKDPGDMNTEEITKNINNKNNII